MSKPKKVKITIENDIVMSPTTTIKDVRDTLWRCRDFELSHLWQRSIFLSAFLILCFTGYAAALQKIAEEYMLLSDYYNLVAFGICIFGIIFSCLWILMGKGSKAWYEIYENSIKFMEKNTTYSTEDAAEIAGFDHTAIAKRYYSQRLNEEESKGKDECELDRCLLSGKGGAYSPSKLNIGIGQITLFFWSIAFICHLALVFSPDLANCHCLKNVIAIFGIVILAIFFYVVYGNKKFSSSVLDDYESERQAAKNTSIDDFYKIQLNKLPNGIKRYCKKQYENKTIKKALVSNKSGGKEFKVVLIDKLDDKYIDLIVENPDKSEVKVRIDKKGKVIDSTVVEPAQLSS